jgi:hypothetical protein
VIRFFIERQFAKSHLMGWKKGFERQSVALIILIVL